MIIEVIVPPHGYKKKGIKKGRTGVVRNGPIFINFSI